MVGGVHPPVHPGHCTKGTLFRGLLYFQINSSFTFLSIPPMPPRYIYTSSQKCTVLIKNGKRVRNTIRTNFQKKKKPLRVELTQCGNYTIPTREIATKAELCDITRVSCYFLDSNNSFNKKKLACFSLPPCPTMNPFLITSSIAAQQKGGRRQHVANRVLYY